MGDNMKSSEWYEEFFQKVEKDNPTLTSKIDYNLVVLLRELVCFLEEKLKKPV